MKKCVPVVCPMCRRQRKAYIEPENIVRPGYHPICMQCTTKMSAGAAPHGNRCDVWRETVSSQNLLDLIDRHERRSEIAKLGRMGIAEIRHRIRIAGRLKRLYRGRCVPDHVLAAALP